ncbi:MAG: hypothetical protein ACK5MZ_05340 [Aestuariibaculum sp.]
MKKTIGLFLTVLVLFLYSYFLLKIWGIDMLEKEQLNNILISIGFSVPIALVLVLVYGFYFKNPAKGYETTDKMVQRKKV